MNSKKGERKAKLRISKKPSLCPSSPLTSPFKTPKKKTEWNVTNKVRAMLPRTPTQFAKVLDNIEKRATPRKRQAIDELKNNESAKKKMIEKEDDLKTVHSTNQENIKKKRMNSPHRGVKPAARLYLAKRAFFKTKKQS